MRSCSSSSCCFGGSEEKEQVCILSYVFPTAVDLTEDARASARLIVFHHISHTSPPLVSCFKQLQTCHATLHVRSLVQSVCVVSLFRQEREISKGREERREGREPR